MQARSRRFEAERVSSPGVARPEVRTTELAATIGVTRQTLAAWVTRELLPKPRRLHLGAHGSSSRFPNYAIELGQYVRQALRESPYGDVAREIAPHTNAAIMFTDSDIADQLVTATIDLRHPREALRAIIDLKYGKVVEFSPFVIVISSK